VGFYRIGLARATPHTRGSTYLHALTFNPNPGYPAHAGIDLKAALRVDGNDWLPRTRGDRPYPCMYRGIENPATPHTRGSTPGSLPGAGFFDGYPAHAGIDQSRFFRELAEERLPRTRGDRPGQRHDIDTIAAATPHTRGSTYPRETPWPLTQGYPAHAGIDLDFGPV
jgi:hypothetical protein